MKMTILLAVGVIAAPALTALLKSPELVPLAAWQKLPLPEGRLSDEDIAQMNRTYGRVETIQANLFRTTRAVLSQGPSARTSLDAGARNPAPPSWPMKPLLLAQTADPAPEAEPSQPEAPATPEPPAAPEAPAAPLAPIARGVQTAVDEIQREVNRAQQQAEKAEVEAKRAFDRAASSFASGDFEPFMNFTTSGSSGHNLIIRSSETDPKSLIAADEDLTVMGRILSKAAGKAGEDEEKTALAIRITSFGSGVRNIQIEGHGVIFLLKANFPLVGPQEKVAEEKPKEPGNSTWEQTRDELYGSHDSSGAMRHLGHPKEPKIKYDPDRVEELENTLLDAMKNASNIRALKDGETVTVVVTSAEDGSAWSVQTGPFGYGSGGGGSANTYVWTGSSSSTSGVHKTHGGTLTIRAKKSDIDAFFHGKLTLEDFRRKATIAVY